ncbi:hypothetical protein P20652_2150 [Pseudoalteromonas sp. BSi20652]|nr:response regulator [Pseudoalteromonas sp. BSi20652]GAA60284.1 hypothetical protein P20652_2150 [Pseudoalteromonas sp. BSi20652]
MSVADSGIGIAKEQQTFLFSEFTQADASVARKYGGTGLGLAISQGLIRKMQGEIQLQSEAGKGCTVSFDISAPEAIYTKLTPAVFEDKTMAIVGKKILLVEDNFINRQVIAKMLEPSKVVITVAEDGLEALNILKNKSFDLILMDCQMPNMDGYECTKYIRENERKNGTHVPIIAITANAYEDDKQRCLNVGMDDFVSKPISSHDLYTVIGNVLS